MYYLLKSGSGVSIQQDSGDPAVYERKFVAKRGFRNLNGTDTLHLEIHQPEMPPVLLKIPLEDLTIGGEEPADKAAALVSLATIFS